MAIRKKSEPRKRVRSNRKGPRKSFADRLRRVLMIAVKVVVLIVAVPALSYGGLKLYHELYSNAHLEINEIEVSGIERVSVEEVIELSNIQTGQNILSVESAEARVAVTGHPWIKSAVVRRFMPDTIKIEVSEREPLVYVLLDTLYVADRSGAIFKRYSPGDRLDLPVITGVEKKDEDEVYGIDENLLGVINYLKGKEGFALSEISEINVDGFKGLTLYTNNMGVRIELGSGSIVDKIALLERVIDERGGRLSGVGSIDLNNERGVVLKFRKKS